MNLQTVRKFRGKCEHGKETNTDLYFPLGVEILDCAETEEDDPEFAVWIKSGEKHFVTTVALTSCEFEAELIANALEAYLLTPQGEERAIEFIKHDMQLDEVTS